MEESVTVLLKKFSRERPTKGFVTRELNRGGRRTRMSKLKIAYMEDKGGTLGSQEKKKGGRTSAEKRG